MNSGSCGQLEVQKSRPRGTGALMLPRITSTHRQLVLRRCTKVCFSLGMSGIKKCSTIISRHRNTAIPVYFVTSSAVRQLLQKYQEGQISLVTSDIVSRLSSLFAVSVSTIPPGFTTSNSAFTLFSTVFYTQTQLMSRN